MGSDPKQEPRVEKQKRVISEEEIEKALENAATEADEEGALINISCSV